LAARWWAFGVKPGREILATVCLSIQVGEMGITLRSLRLKALKTLNRKERIRAGDVG
jgi:hypothetical protein